jgi:hypothetical protein
VSPAAASASAPEEASAPVPDGGRVAPSGGNWLKCYANFQPRNRPELDVERLGLMCGPSNGMRKQAHTEGDLTTGEAEHRFHADAGDCYRIFAVGAPGIEDLDVEVFDPQKTKIAFDTSDDRWPIVKPDAPFCVFEGGDYRAVVRAQRGQGHYAIEIWRLH